MVKTRSQSKKEEELNRTLLKEVDPVKPLYEVNIDFDAASNAWMTNKISIGNGHYKYICIYNKNGSRCGKSCYKELIYCWHHRNAGSK